MAAMTEEQMYERLRQMSPASASDSDDAPTSALLDGTTNVTLSDELSCKQMLVNVAKAAYFEDDDNMEKEAEWKRLKNELREYQSTGDLNLEPKPQKNQRPEQQQGEEQETKKQTETEENDIDEETLCIMCCDKPATAAAMPCGHVCGCLDCLTTCMSTTKKCPICRTEIEQIQEIHLSMKRSGFKTVSTALAEPFSNQGITRADARKALDDAGGNVAAAGQALQTLVAKISNYGVKLNATPLSACMELVKKFREEEGEDDQEGDGNKESKESKESGSNSTTSKKKEKSGGEQKTGDFVPTGIQRGLGELGHLVDASNKHGCIIIGGAARWMASKNTKPVKTGDVDIVCKNMEAHLALIEELTSGSTNVYNIKKKNSMTVDLILSQKKLQNAFKPTSQGGLGWDIDKVVPYDKWKDTPANLVQIIIPRRTSFALTGGANTIEEQLSFLDFTVTRAAVVDRSIVLVDKDFHRDEGQKKIVIKHIVCPLGSVQRLMKYSKKGYKCSMLEIIKLFIEWSHRMTLPMDTPDPDDKLQRSRHIKDKLVGGLLLQQCMKGKITKKELFAGVRGTGIDGRDEVEEGNFHVRQMMWSWSWWDSWEQEAEWGYDPDRT